MVLELNVNYSNLVCSLHHLYSPCLVLHLNYFRIYSVVNYFTSFALIFKNSLPEFVLNIEICNSHFFQSFPSILISFCLLGISNGRYTNSTFISTKGITLQKSRMIRAIIFDSHCQKIIQKQFWSNCCNSC